MIGGYNDGQFLKTIEVYSEKRKIWEMTKVTMKTERNDMGVAVIGDLIFIIGGWNGRRGVVEEVEVMNTTTQTMETLTRNPTGRRGMGVGVVDDRFIWTFGGFDDVIEMCVTSKNQESGRVIDCEDDITTCLYSRAVVVNGQDLDHWWNDNNR